MWEYSTVCELLNPHIVVQIFDYGNIEYVGRDTRHLENWTKFVTVCKVSKHWFKDIQNCEIFENF